MRIVITGAESSGKTTLITDLADHFGLSFTTEYARAYLIAKNANYNYSDLLTIAKGQHELIEENKNKILAIHLDDTDLLTIKIWSEFKYKKCDPWIIKTLKNSKPDLYILCAPDIPWEEDPLRENPNDRQEIFKIFEHEIQELNVPYEIVSGLKHERLDQALSFINSLKKSK